MIQKSRQKNQTWDLPYLVLTDNRLHSTAKIVFLLLWTYSPETKDVFSKITKELNVTRSAVARAGVLLEKLGYIEKVNIRSGGRYFDLILTANPGGIK